MADVFDDHPALPPERARLWPLVEATPWLGNVWIGTSVENQEWAEKRIPVLLHLPAIVRFVSCEPLIGPVDLHRITARNGAYMPPRRPR